MNKPNKQIVCSASPSLPLSYSYSDCIRLGNWCTQQTSHLLFYPIIHPAYTETNTTQQHGQSHSPSLSLSHIHRLERQIQRLCMHPHLHPPGLIHWLIDPLTNQVSAHNQQSYRRGTIHSFRECLSVLHLFIRRPVSFVFFFFSSSNLLLLLSSLSLLLLARATPSVTYYLYFSNLYTTKMAVGPRVSKEEFMNALGLSPQDELFYRAMRVSPPLLPTNPPYTSTPY